MDNSGIYFLLVIIALIIIDFITKKLKKDNSLLMSSLYVVAMIYLIFLYTLKEYWSIIIYNYTESFYFLNDLCVISIIGCVMFSIYCLYNYNKTKRLEYLKLSFVLLGGLVYEYTMSMGTTEAAHNAGSIMIFSTIIALILEKFYDKENIIKYFTIVLSFFIIITVTSQKVSNPYVWWNCDESSTKSEKIYSINVPGLEGYKTTLNQKTMYEEMYKVTKENTNENSVIYGFPNVKIFNVLLKNSNITTFVPVPWYDVCSDEYAIKDAEKLQENPPDIVIWNDAINAVKAHEKVFRDGKPLGQRKIIEWFSTEVDKKKLCIDWTI